MFPHPCRRSLLLLSLEMDLLALIERDVQYPPRLSLLLSEVLEPLMIIYSSTIWNPDLARAAPGSCTGVSCWCGAWELLWFLWNPHSPSSLRSRLDTYLFLRGFGLDPSHDTMKPCQHVGLSPPQ